jgi:hypothetical protein
VRGARWSYRGPFPRRAVRAAKIKLIIASRDAWCKRTVMFAAYGCKRHARSSEARVGSIGRAGGTYDTL